MELTVSITADDSLEMKALPGHSRPPPLPRVKPKWNGNNKRQKVNPTSPSPLYSTARVLEALEGLTNTEKDSLAEALLPVTKETTPSEARETEEARVTTSTVRDSVFLVGRYRKESRVMPQTPWIIGGERKGVSSVEEVLASALREQIDCAEVKFRASGREDCDVRMLGTGRPFSLELVDPKRFVTVDVAKAAEAIRRLSADLLAPVDVVDLATCDLNAAHSVDADVQAKTKTYSCIVWFQKTMTRKQLRDLDNLKNITVKQKTPVRVVHSRSLATRTRQVYSLHLLPINAHFATLTLSTQAGTYIKEFVHGDFGRTTPSLGSLLHTKADILQLDVLDVANNDD